MTITELPSYKLISAINKAYVEGWIDMTARDALIAFYLEHLGEYLKAPRLAELMEHYSRYKSEKENVRGHLLKHGMWSDAE